MAQEQINIGASVGDGTGDPLRTSFDKTNKNFDEVYQAGDIDTRQYTKGLPNPTHKEGLVFYDDTKKALSFYNDSPDVTVNIGQEVIIKVYNDNGATITNGTVVRLSTPVNGLPTVVRAKADTTANARSVGVATHDIEVDAEGDITVTGTVSDIDTSNYTAGDILFLSSTVAGEFTNAEQVILKPIGVVITVSANDGLILVYPTEIIEPTAIGQVAGLNGSSQSGITPTPVPLEVYRNTNLLEKNVSITQTGASPYTASISPDTAGASGFYRVAFTISINSTQNDTFIFEVFVNGLGTGVIGIIDLSNNNIDFGSTGFGAITTSPVTDSDSIEIYVSCGSGSKNFTVQSSTFSIERLGNL